MGYFDEELSYDIKLPMPFIQGMVGGHAGEIPFPRKEVGKSKDLSKVEDLMWYAGWFACRYDLARKLDGDAKAVYLTAMVFGYSCKEYNEGWDVVMETVESPEAWEMIKKSEANSVATAIMAVARTFALDYTFEEKCADTTYNHLEDVKIFADGADLSWGRGGE